MCQHPERTNICCHADSCLPSLSEDTIVLLPEEKADSCQRDSKCWRVMGACTYMVIDEGVTSIGNAFDCGSTRISEITLFENLPLLTTDD